MARSIRVPYQHFDGNGTTRAFDRRKVRVKANVAFLHLVFDEDAFVPTKPRHIKNKCWMGGSFMPEYPKLARK